MVRICKRCTKRTANCKLDQLEIRSSIVLEIYLWLSCRCRRRVPVPCSSSRRLTDRQRLRESERERETEEKKWKGLIFMVATNADVRSCGCDRFGDDTRISNRPLIDREILNAGNWLLGHAPHHFSHFVSNIFITVLYSGVNITCPKKTKRW